MITPSAQDSEVLSFGPFRLIANERRLTKDGEPVELSGRALDILLTLTSQPHKIISKCELMAHVWPGITIEDSTLRFHVANLRKALGDQDPGARYIATEPGRGYSFAASVSRAAGRSTQQQSLEGGFRHTNLPDRATEMIGREDDLERMRAHLYAGRFVTIVGPGGVGKTTLAVALGHRLLEGFAGAILFGDLSMVSDPALVPTVIASMLGLSVRSDNVTPAIEAYLRNQRVLLILDTCEHLVGSVAEFASRIFRSARQVHILATSREALQVGGEHVLRLEPLKCPPDDAVPSAAVARTFPAIQLFVERAVAGGAKLDFTDEEAATVTRMCRKLDGVALAIELAARQVGAYGIDQIAALLDERLTLLWEGPRTAPPRQKTLQATLDWSFNLLSEVERTVLRRLAVFVGHFTLDAATAVATSANLDRTCVFNAIGSLVAKSMLAASPMVGVMRYRLLDTTRAYALQIPIGKSDEADLAARHATYFLRWLEQSNREWPALSTGAERVPHFANLDNVRAALEWSFGNRGNPEIGIKLAAATVPAFLAMSLLSECHRWSERALLALDDTTRGSRVEMHLQAGLGISSMLTMANGEHAHMALTRGLELAEKFLDPENQLRFIGQLHLLHRRVGNFNRMLAFAQRSEAVATVVADPTAMATADVLLGVSHHLIGNQADARAYVEAALAREPARDRVKARHYGFYYERARIVLARTLWLLGYPDQAVRIARQTVGELADSEAVTVCIALIWGGSVFRWAGDLTSADECIDRLIWYADRHSLTPYRAVGDGLHGEVLIRAMRWRRWTRKVTSSTRQSSTARWPRPLRWWIAMTRLCRSSIVLSLRQ
ncbi:winged helix-turn-helix domain-containing protein [Bradyrhizobium sp. B117]|uniref:ATP-binding protein n=1 Tax=Bradyrhizobium sp. B117 TaxID=3140246 RepID=UPI0031836653